MGSTTMQQQQQQQLQPARPRIPFKVFVETLKSKKGDLMVAGFALVCLVISTGKISLKRERKQLEAEYEQRFSELESENAALRDKIAAVKDRVLGEASRTTGRGLPPMSSRLNAIFDELSPQQKKKQPESSKPDQPAGKFFV